LCGGARAIGSVRATAHTIREELDMRKLMVTTAIAGMALVLGAGPAFAHECYNASRSAQGNTSIAAHAPTFQTFNNSAFMLLTDPEGPGLCDAGANWLIGQIDANAASLGISDTTVVFMQTTQAQGIDNSPNERAHANLSNGKGVDHLAENVALNDFIGANIGAAFGQCA
jgi:hypothetical protein